MNETEKITIRKILIEGCAELNNSGVGSPMLDARILLEHSLSCSHEELVREYEKSLNKKQADSYYRLIARRKKREPISCIVGDKEFWGINFATTTKTLDPRSDSETIIESVIKYFPRRQLPLRILDIGTGTGCLLLSTLSEYNEATGVGVDISEDALHIAETNADNLDLGYRAEFIKSKWADNVKGTFNIIISNPPYIKSSDIAHLDLEVKNYDPHIALDGGDDGLKCYREIISTIPDLLKDNGAIFFEVGEGQADDVTMIAEHYGFTIKEKARDLAGIERCIIAHKK